MVRGKRDRLKQARDRFMFERQRLLDASQRFAVKTFGQCLHIQRVQFQRQ
jgi:hypothetical protein